MPTKIYMIGKKFNRLLVLEDLGPTIHKKIFYLCICDCGKQVKVDGYYMRVGRTKSCGCYHDEGLHRTHGESKKGGAYNSWRGMRERCLNENNSSYKNYGAKGIVICDRWINSFEEFLADMGPRPSPNHSLDRFPETKGNYVPDNCRWATRSEQARNRTDNYILEFEGKIYIFSDLAKHLNISQDKLRNKIKCNRIQVLVIQPPRSRK